MLKNALFALLFLLPLTSSFAAGVVVVAGGGEEGKPGDKKAWSYDLYKRLIDNGDITGDKKIKVAVLSYYKQEDSWYSDYFKSLGANHVEAVVAETRDEANDPSIADKLKDADVIFFRGGDQAEYYNNWKGTLLEKNIKSIDKNGGAIGGTSAGAMSLAGYALAGGQELGSKDVLMDAKTKMLDDVNGGSSIHNDFLNIVPDAIIETHYGERARLGRTVGAHAKASEDFKRKDLLSIAVSEQTGIAISNGKAQVYGNGTVEFIQQTPETKSIRQSGSPLIYTDLRNDVLTEGWVFDMKTKTPDLTSRPSDSQAVDLRKKCGGVKTPFTIDGSKKSDADYFEYSPKYGAENYKLHHSPKTAKISGVIGITRANSFSSDPSGGKERAKVQAALYRSIYDAPNKTAFLISEESLMKSSADNADLIIFEKNLQLDESESASIILDCSGCTHKGLSPRVTELDNGSKSLRLPALINLRMHVMGSSLEHNLSYNLKTHEIQILKEIDVKNGCSLNSEIDLKEIKNSLESFIANISACEP